MLTRNQIRQNINLNNHNDHRFCNNQRQIKLARQFGREIAVAIASRNLSKLSDIICVSPSNSCIDYAISLVQHTNNLLVLENFFICACCNCVTPIEEKCNVIVDYRRRIEHWCWNCRDYEATCCHSCGDWYDNDYIVTDNHTHLCESCYENYYFTCISCNYIYHVNDGNGELCINCRGETEEDDDGLIDYHKSYRDWRILHSCPNIPFTNSPPLGVELEVYCEDRSSCIKAIRSDCPFDVLLERDGSLCEIGGFEIITHPMGLHEHKTQVLKLLNILSNYKATGWYGKCGVYGMHITVSRQYLSPLQEARLMLFLTAEENLNFVTVIAQRERIYSPDMNIGSLIKQNQRIENINTRGWIRRNKTKKIGGAGKYCPINFKPDLAEFRIFQSTVNLKRYLKNIEFVYSLIEWTNPKTATGSKWYYKDFLDWLFKNHKNKKSCYVNLVTYLQQSEFSIKGCGKVKNTFI